MSNITQENRKNVKSVVEKILKPLKSNYKLRYNKGFFFWLNICWAYVKRLFSRVGWVLLLEWGISDDWHVATHPQPLLHICRNGDK